MSPKTGTTKVRPPQTWKFRNRKIRCGENSVQRKFAPQNSVRRKSGSTKIQFNENPVQRKFVSQNSVRRKFRTPKIYTPIGRDAGPDVWDHCATNKCDDNMKNWNKRNWSVSVPYFGRRVKILKCFVPYSVYRANIVLNIFLLLALFRDGPKFLEPMNLTESNCWLGILSFVWIVFSSIVPFELMYYLENPLSHSY